MTVTSVISVTIYFNFVQYKIFVIINIALLSWRKIEECEEKLKNITGTYLNFVLSKKRIFIIMTVTSIIPVTIYFNFVQYKIFKEYYRNFVQYNIFTIINIILLSWGGGTRRGRHT